VRLHVTRRRALAAAALALAVTASVAAVEVGTSSATTTPDNSSNTASPIKHVVVIFDENVSYDHYFATYPSAANTDGVPFTPSASTPSNNNLVTSHLLTGNPNTYQPFRLTPSEVQTCDQNHNYGPEQKAFDGGAMDKFVQNVSTDTCSGGLFGAPGLTMGYYDGNTVTGLWNYAQNYAMSDNSFDTTFGPSTPGALNLVAGQTHGVTAVDSKTGAPIKNDGYASISQDDNGVGTVINDPDPAYDDCADTNHTSTNAVAEMSGRNIGNLLNDKGVTWGWFQGGFKPTTPYAGSGTYAVCGATHTNVSGTSVVDYSAHHSPFEYYESTANPHHLPPTSVYAIGHNDQANHNYDLSDFNNAVTHGVLPAVSFLKAPEYQDGHAGYSDPIDEQHFLTSEINMLQSSPFWKDTAVILAYDDSDGWYDHAAPTIANSSTDTANDAAICTQSNAGASGPIDEGYLDRCGPGPRLPLLVISPYAKSDYIDHTASDQASVLATIEANWKTGPIGDSSFDATAGSLLGMFNFSNPPAKQVLLGSNGEVQSVKKISLK
jgi:phospholipase C